MSSTEHVLVCVCVCVCVVIFSIEEWTEVLFIFTKGRSLDLYLDQVLSYKHSAEPQIWGMVPNQTDSKDELQSDLGQTTTKQTDKQEEIL